MADAADPLHDATCRERDACLRDGGILVTTDYVIDETLTLVRVRLGLRRALTTDRHFSQSGFELVPREALRCVAHEKTLPFAPLVPNDETIEAMREARRGNLRQFSSVEDLLDDRHADD